MNLVLEATRQTVMSKYAPGEDDLYMRTLELGQVQESDFTAMSCTMIWTASSGTSGKHTARTRPPPTRSPRWMTSRKSLNRRSNRAARGSGNPRILRQNADTLREDFLRGLLCILRILSLSKMLKNPNNMRGKAKPQPYYAPKRKKRR